MVLACPAITPAKKLAMEQRIGYRHSMDWWAVEGNAAAAKSFRMAGTGATPQSAQQEALADYTHGIATICGQQRLLYFDLGGYHNLMDDTDYQKIIQGINDNTIRDASRITPIDMGYDCLLYTSDAADD